MKPSLVARCSTLDARRLLVARRWSLAARRSRLGGDRSSLATRRSLLAAWPLVALAIAAAATVIRAADIKVDLGKETVGRTPVAFEPMVGTWTVAQDGADKVIMVDGRPWVASKDNPTKLLIESARKLYGTSNEELMDNAKQFAYFPVAVLKSVDNFTNGTITMKFKTIAGDADRASGILFNVKPNGDWLAVRYNDTENNVALWEFHNGIRRNMKFNRDRKFMLDRTAWHELKLTIDGADLKTWLDGDIALEYTIGSMPGPGRGGAAPHPDLIPANNAVLQPPVKGKIGLWAKTDSTSYFKDYVVSPK
jgi:3-keto-disaccharide hydrolase